MTKGIKRFLRDRITAFLLLFLAKKQDNIPKAEDLAGYDFKTSIQRLGVRFNRKVRGVFRFRWIKKI